jgi:nucleoid DNA-binding protein
MAKKSVLKGIVEKSNGVVKSQKDASVVFDAVFEAVVEAVKAGEDVRTSAGIFKKRHKNARRIAGREMTLPNGKVVTIKEGMTAEKDVLVLKSKVVL